MNIAKRHQKGIRFIKIGKLSSSVKLKIVYTTTLPLSADRLYDAGVAMRLPFGWLCQDTNNKRFSCILQQGGITVGIRTVPRKTYYFRCVPYFLF
jgi:hypothetical protein